jgi:hypothetical protein
MANPSLHGTGRDVDRIDDSPSQGLLVQILREMKKITFLLSKQNNTQVSDEDIDYDA